MPTIKLADSDIQFFYTDSGAPPEGSSDYATIIIIHGHAYHSGSLKQLDPSSVSRPLRIIAINRREYPGSTPLSEEERRQVKNGTEEDRRDVLRLQGVYLARLVDALIVDLSLSKAGGVALFGWSLGNVFLLALLGAIDGVSEPARERLAEYVSSVILFEPPCGALGIPQPGPKYITPLEDESIPLAGRPLASGYWYAAYWDHGDLSTRDVSQLITSSTPPSRRPSTLDGAGSLLAEIRKIADLKAGPNSENAYLTPPSPWGSVLAEQRDKVLLNPSTRDVWKRLSGNITHLYGDSSPWIVIHPAWIMEDRAKELNLSYHTRMIRGVNHFMVWDQPNTALKEIEKCLP